jgi:predicted acylesterase/phospholipase RssA
MPAAQEIRLEGTVLAVDDIRTINAARPLHVALVLSGGGSKGSFEVGALQFLYSRGFFAKTICGTSVGSVNGLQLAHGGTPASQATAFTALLTFWNGISWSNPFYVQTPLLTQALNAIRNWERTAEGGIEAVDVIMWPIGASKILSVLGSTVPLVGPALQARALFDMSPLRTMIRGALNTAVVRTSGVSLRLCVVCLETGEVRYVDEAGRLLDRELRPIATPLGTAPQCQALERQWRAAETARDGIRQSNYMAGGRFDRADYLRDVAEARRAAGQAKAAFDACTLKFPPVPQPVGLQEATMASAAIPVAFAPVAIAGEHYVDGGAMLQLPIEAAIKADPDVIVAVNTGRLTIDRKEGWGTATVVPIAERTVFDLLMPEALARQIELAEKSGKPIFLIAPRIDVHGTLEQDPGLLAINIDYGFMCAADIAGDMTWSASVPTSTLAGAFGIDPPVITARKTPVDPVLADLADAITRARLLCWTVEYEVLGENLPASPFGRPPALARSQSVDALDRLRDLKTLVGILAMARTGLGGLLPPTSTSWSTSYEAHSFTFLGTPWAAFNSSTGTRLAGTPNTALVVTDASTGANSLLTPAGRFPITVLGTILTGGTPAVMNGDLFSALPLGPAI